jgi:dimethylhistidine N-methyltransferase
MSSLARVNLRLETARFLTHPTPGYCVIRAGMEEKDNGKMARDVAEGLSRVDRKSLPSMYFYDAIGSSLYEQITSVPEYYPTRCEADILRQHTHQLTHMLEAPVVTSTLVELGSGSSTKTRILLDAWQAKTQPVTYIPLDVSESILTESARTLSADYPSLQVVALAGRYEDCLNLLTPGPERLFLFLGGTIGNFTAGFQNIFFMNLAKQMGAGARLLVGYDRMPHANKPKALIERAYNDNAQVTAAFNRNILSHINHTLDANFRLSAWQHEAVYNSEKNQIEMYLESTRFQRVEIGQLKKTFVFEPGEHILTEISRKFDPDELADWFEAMGYRCLANWTDAAELFGVLLLEV